MRIDDSVPQNNWTVIEISTSIICACLPATSKLIRRIMMKIPGAERFLSTVNSAVRSRTRTTNASMKTGNKSIKASMKTLNIEMQNQNVGTGNNV